MSLCTGSPSSVSRRRPVVPVATSRKLAQSSPLYLAHSSRSFFLLSWATTAMVLRCVFMAGAFSDVVAASPGMGDEWPQGPDLCESLQWRCGSVTHVLSRPG